MATSPASNTTPAATDLKKSRGEFAPDGRGTGPGTSVQYGKKWALIIGVNYASREPSWGRGPDQLANAENDARAVRDTLVDYYGYQPECVRFLAGGVVKAEAAGKEGHSPRPATMAEIKKALDTGLLCSEQVKEDDSVLVFFSGHGHLRGARSGAQSSGYIFPADMEMDADKSPQYEKAVDVRSDVVEKLQKHCRARHKLLILDCCYSGAVFQVGVGMKGVGSRGEYAFRDPGFQAMTAGPQLVPDGPRGGNSPFTAALISGLTNIPQRRTSGPEPFPASEVFKTVQADLQADRVNRQSPEYGWIGADQGEFFFVPHPTKPWPQESKELDEAGRKQLLAMVPSTTGNWWADEMVWFMPALRHEILRDHPVDRSAEQYFKVETIRRVALNLIAERRANTTRPIGYRYDHLIRLLDAKTVDEQLKALDASIEGLEKEYPRAGANPGPGTEPSAERALDLHYLAVLYHKRKKTIEASECYNLALAEYKSLLTPKPDPDGVPAGGRPDDTPSKTLLALKSKLGPLYALCHMDYGILCQTVLNRFEDARSLFALARERDIVGDNPPVPFVAFTLYKEAEAARRLGMFGVSDFRMKIACDRMFNLDRDRTHPMTGAVLKYDAWACMEQCRFDQARASFLASEKVFAGLLSRNPGTFSYQIELFHIAHGLAMIERFQGEDGKALKQFRALTDDIAEKVHELDRSDYLPDYAAVRQLLADRYVNSLDRQGDCQLYGRVPDYAEAADDYRRALRATARIPEDRRELITLDLYYRRAIALAMASPAQNLDLAEHLCDDAAALEGHLSRRHNVVDASRKPTAFALPRKTLINKAVALTLTRRPRAPKDNDLWNLIAPGADAAPRVGEKPDDAARVPLAVNSLDREEVERMMFGCSLLLQNRKEWGLNDLQALACCDQLLSACRAATRPVWVVSGQADRGLLFHLRPYYDRAFQFKAEQTPPPVKELVEIAWEATRGNAYRKPKEITPLLVLYQTTTLQGCSPQSYVLLDVRASKDRPGGISQCYALGTEWCSEDLLKRASVTGGGLPLPAELSRTFAGVKFEHELQVRWRDPVTELGVSKRPPEDRSAFRTGSGTPSEGAATHLSKDVPSRFPFNLGAHIPEDRYSDLAELTALGLQAARKADAIVEHIPEPKPPVPTAPVKP